MALREAEGFDPSRVVAAKAATSVIPVRPSATGWEMLMVLRPEASRVAGGHYVWPGGKVEAADVEGSRLIDGTVRGAAHIDGIGGVVAAGVREAYEEVGLPLFDPMPVRDIGQNAEAAAFWQWLDEAGARIGSQRLHHAMTWLTPKGVPSRFHSHFLLAEVDPAWIPTPHPQEVASVGWFSPAEALRAFEVGTIQLMFPTYHTVRILSVAHTLDDLRTLIDRIPNDVVEPTIGPDEGGAIGVQLPEFLRTFIHQLGV